MNRRVMLAVALAAFAAGASAEVSVDGAPEGGYRLFFEPAPTGPWARVRPGIAPAHILNPMGDATGDAWPALLQNEALGWPEAAWADSADVGEILFAYHDDKAWSPPINVSCSAELDLNVDLAADTAGNHLLAWQSESDAGAGTVRVRALNASASGMTLVGEIAELDERRPSLAAPEPGVAYVAHEQRSLGGTGLVKVSVTQVVFPVNDQLEIDCSGENSPDLMRHLNITTQLNASSSMVPAPRVDFENGHLWITWIHTPISVGFVELLAPGVFSPPQLRPFSPLVGDEIAREAIRQEILGL